MGEAGELAHELQRRGANFFLGRRRLEIKQRADIAAHRLVSVSSIRARGGSIPNFPSPLVGERWEGVVRRCRATTPVVVPFYPHPYLLPTRGRGTVLRRRPGIPLT